MQNGDGYALRKCHLYALKMNVTWYPIMKIQLIHTFEEIISLENLLLAWQEFIRGKRHKRDVQAFAHNLMDNILALHCDLANKKYVHGSYESFRICDSKPRHIHIGIIFTYVFHLIERIF